MALQPQLASLPSLALARPVAQAMTLDPTHAVSARIRERALAHLSKVEMAEVKWWQEKQDDKQDDTLSLSEPKLELKVSYDPALYPGTTCEPWCKGESLENYRVDLVAMGLMQQHTVLCWAVRSSVATIPLAIWFWKRYSVVRYMVTERRHTAGNRNI